MNIEAFLQRLENVKPAGPNKWMARCPAHEDRTASLSIRLAEDDRILLNDFGMHCPVPDICAALGLMLRDLMPPSTRAYMRPEERGTNVTRATANDVLSLLDHEALVVWNTAQMLATGQRLHDGVRDRLTLAVQRIGHARALINPAKGDGNAKPSA